MSNKDRLLKRVAVQDANILIDLEMADLFDAWFSLGIETHTTNLVVSEIRRGGHTVAMSHVIAQRIKSHVLDTEKMGRLVAIKTEIGNSVSMSDCSALVLAMDLDSFLLTGDGPLRNHAKSRCVEVHGTLWIMDRIVAAGAMASVTVADRLQSLLTMGRFLPRSECEKLLKIWRAAGHP